MMARNFVKRAVSVALALPLLMLAVLAPLAVACTLIVSVMDRGEPPVWTPCERRRRS